MNINKIVCFDMDGTLCDLYGVADWLPKLRAEDPSPYEEAEPLVDMARLNETVALLQKAGWEIQVITALSKDASPEYKEAIRAAKKAWLNKWGFVYDRFHGVDYKTPKCEVIRRQMGCGMRDMEWMYDEGASEAILIDDETRHINRWGWGRAINPAETDIIDELLTLLPPELMEEEG